MSEQEAIFDRAQEALCVVREALENMARSAIQEWEQLLDAYTAISHVAG